MLWNLLVLVSLRSDNGRSVPAYVASAKCACDFPYLAKVALDKGHTAPAVVLYHRAPLMEMGTLMAVHTQTYMHALHLLHYRLIV